MKFYTKLILNDAVDNSQQKQQQKLEKSNSDEHKNSRMLSKTAGKSHR